MGVAVILVAHAAFPAIQYEFIQTSRSDSDTTDFTARAFVDGERSRSNSCGNAYPPGTYVISIARTLLFVDPTQKAYTELNTMSVASAIGTSSIKIDNFVPTVTSSTINPHRGHPGRSLPADDDLRHHGELQVHAGPAAVYAVIDKWTTVQFGDVGEAVALMNGLQTGTRRSTR